MRMSRPGYFAGLSASEYFRRLPVRLVEIHLHDNNGQRDQHAHFGFGSVPFAEVAAALKAITFDGVATIEIAPGFHERTPEESKPDAVRSLQEWRRLIDPTD
jgi:sugar phosphate isomerase/epimerase